MISDDRKGFVGRAQVSVFSGAVSFCSHNWQKCDKRIVPVSRAYILIVPRWVFFSFSVTLAVKFSSVLIVPSQWGGFIYTRLDRIQTRFFFFSFSLGPS